jgi:ribosome-binding protein aMBF1 (putative translation factor)
MLEAAMRTVDAVVTYDAPKAKMSTEARKIFIEVLAQALNDERERLGLTQRELAKRTGVPVDRIDRAEGGKHEPRVTTVAELPDAMGVNWHEFVVGFQWRLRQRATERPSG